MPPLPRDKLVGSIKGNPRENRSISSGDSWGKGPRGKLQNQVT